MKNMYAAMTCTQTNFSIKINEKVGNV